MKLEEQPLVSILMTAYNREKYIAEAIESVLASTYTNFELIIVDDGSIDKTVEIAKTFKEKDRRIKVYVNEVNLGQFPNRNKAAEYANGEYIMYVDSDDKIFKQGITLLIEAMLSNPQSSFGMRCITVKEVNTLPPKDAIKNHFFHYPFLVHGPGATIIKKNFFNNIGKYPVEYGIPGDMYFNLKACCYTDIMLIPFDFMYYRIHKNQELSNSYDYLYNNYKYLNEALLKLPLGLAEEEVFWLRNKNKRRFSINIIRYLSSSLNFKKTFKAIKLADFSIKDFITGVLFFSSKPKNHNN